MLLISTINKITGVRSKMNISVVYWYNKQNVIPSAIPNNMVMKWDNCAKTLNVIYHSLFYNLFIGRYILTKGKAFSFFNFHIIRNSPISRKQIPPNYAYNQ